MVLLPGCSCCATCQQTFQSLRNANSIELTISASDYLRTQRGTYTGVPLDAYGYDDFCGMAKNSTFGATQLFPGTTFSGTYSLSKIDSGLWRYSFPASGFVCSSSSARIEAQMGLLDGVYIFSLALSFQTFSHCVMNAETYIGKNEFDCNIRSYACAGSNLIRPPGEYFTQAINTELHNSGVSAVVQCSDGVFPLSEGIGPLTASVTNPCIVNTVNLGPSMTFTTVSESGSLSVSFSNIAFT